MLAACFLDVWRPDVVDSLVECFASALLVTFGFTLLLGLPMLPARKNQLSPYRNECRAVATGGETFIYL